MILLAASVATIAWLESYKNVSEKEISGVLCPSVVDASAANLDFYAATGERTGDYHCFCKNKLDAPDGGVDSIIDYKFPLD